MKGFRRKIMYKVPTDLGLMVKDTGGTKLLNAS